MNLFGRIKELWNNIRSAIDALWGYDVYIVHRRKDSEIYAGCIYEKLKDEITCFIDKEEFLPGDSLRLATIRHIKRSTALVVIGSPELLLRHDPHDWVDTELEEYKKKHNNNQVVTVIVFGDVVRDALETKVPDLNWIKNLNYLRDFLYIYESHEALATSPSEEVIRKILNNLEGRRRDRRRVRFFQSVAAVFVFLAIYAAYEWRNAEIGQIKALSEASKAKFVSNPDSFDALLDALRASKRLQNPLLLSIIKPELNVEVLTALTSSVFWVKEKNRLEPNFGTVNGLSYSPIGKMLATANENKTIGLWNGNYFDKLEGNTGMVLSVSFHRKGKFLASSNKDGNVHIWKKQNDNKWKKELEFELAFLVGKFYDEALKLVVEQQFYETITVINDVLRTKITVGDIDKKEKITEILIPALKNKYPHKTNKFEVFLKDLQKSESKLSGDNPLKTYMKQSKLVEVRVVKFSKSGKFFAFGSTDGTVNVYESDGYGFKQTIKIERKEEEKKCGINSLSFSPTNEHIIAMANHCGVIDFWDWKVNKEAISSVPVGEKDMVGSVQFSPDGKYILAGSLTGGTLKLCEWNGEELTEAKCKLLPNNNGGIETVNFSSDGKILVSAGNDNVVKVWNLDRILMNEFSGHSDVVTSVSFISSDGQLDQQKLASASIDGTIKFWQLNAHLKILPNGNEKINRFSCDSNCDIIATASNKDGKLKESKLKLWRRDGTLIATLSGDTDNHIQNVSVSFDGKKIASANQDGTVKLLELNENGEPKCTDKQCFKDFFQKEQLDEDLNPINFINVSFSPNNQMIAITTKKGGVQLYQLDNSEKNFIKRTQTHKKIAYDVSFSADSKMLASAGGDGIVKLWNAENGFFIGESEKHDGKLYQVEFNRDSNMIVAASSSGLVKRWKIKLDDETKPLKPIEPLRKTKFDPSVTDVIFNPNNQILASANEKGTIFIWGPDGMLITELVGHSKSVIGLNFSIDGTALVSASDGGSIILWNLKEWNLDNLSLDNFEELGCSWMQDYFLNNKNNLYPDVC